MWQEEQQERSIPANIEAERAVLGSLMIDPDAMEKIGGLLLPKDFFRERHGWLYETMTSLYERREPLDFVTIIDDLERRDRLQEIGGPAYITDLVASTPTAAYVEYYAKIVKRDAVLRGLIAVSGNIAELAYNSGQLTLEEVMAKAEAMLTSVEAPASGNIVAFIGDLLPDELATIENVGQNPTGIPTGYQFLDRMIGGMQRTDLMILAARPSMGKTTCAINFAFNGARRVGARSLIVSLEMSKSQMLQKVLALASAIDSNKLRNGTVSEDEWPILLATAAAIKDMPIALADPPAANINIISHMARKHAYQHGLDILVVDYMQLISGTGSGDNGNRQQEISYISRQLKALARELRIVVIGISQLSRAVEQRADKRPMQSDLRESGQIEQDADEIVFLYREDYYVEDTDRQNIVDLILAKNRHGATGTVSVFFRKETGEFRDLETRRTELEY